MKKTIAIFAASTFIMVGIAIYLNAGSDSNFNLNNYQTVEVDNFDHEGYWTAKFSKFRSVNEDAVMQIPQYSEPKSSDQTAKQTRMDSKEFVRWIGNEDDKERDIIPQGLREYKKDQLAGKVLGVKGNWDFPGYNWVSVEPTFTRSAGLYPATLKDDKVACMDGSGNEYKFNDACKSVGANSKATPPYNFIHKMYEFDPSNHRPKLLPTYIQLPGQSQAIDFWVWGKGMNYRLEVHFEDFNGNVHITEGPRLTFLGWRNARIAIPSFIPQTQKYLPPIQGIKMVRFKVTSDPTEKTNEFYTYFDFMQVLTDMYEPAFPGDDLLGHPKWNKGASPSTTRTSVTN